MNINLFTKKKKNSLNLFVCKNQISNTLTTKCRNIALLRLYTTIALRTRALSGIVTYSARRLSKLNS